MKTKLLFLTSLLFGLSIQFFAYSYERVDSTMTEDSKVIHITEASVPWDIYVMEIDLTKTDLKIKTGLANGLVSYSFTSTNYSAQMETIADMVTRLTNDGEDVVGGINGDFYNTTYGKQFNVTATGGRIAHTGTTSSSLAGLYVDENGVPTIDLIELQHTATISGVGDYAINNVNKGRGADELAIFDHFTGRDQSTSNQWGRELLLEPQSQPYINGTTNYKVLAKEAKATMTSPEQIILTGHGAASTFLGNAEIDDIIQISSTVARAGEKKIYEMIGGWGHIVTGGANSVAAAIAQEGSMGHENDRHPRSAVGYNQDKTKLYMVAVDGASDISGGMNLDEMANFMIDELGVYEALNFSGGSSTTLMGGDQTFNTPSGDEQKPVANALLVVKEAVTGISDVPTVQQVSLFPNPAPGYINVSWQGEVGSALNFEVYDLTGRLVFTKDLGMPSSGDNSRRVELPALKSGTYVCRLISDGVVKGTGKILVK